MTGFFSMIMMKKLILLISKIVTFCKKLVKVATGSGYPGQWNLEKSLHKGA